MNATILCKKMEPEEGYSARLEDKRRSLADYISSQTPAISEHLGIVVKYLHGNLPFVELKDHAKNLPNVGNKRETVNVRKLVSELNESELPIVEDYFTKYIAAYINGEGFDIVDKILDNIIDLKPIPDTIYAPPGSFPEDLARAREEV